MGPLPQFSDDKQRQELFGLWKKQEQILISTGIPEAMGMDEREFSDYLELFAREAIEGGMGYRPPLIPFLIVIGERAVGILKQLRSLKINGLRGAVRLKPGLIKERRDDFRFSNLVYLIFGVEDGSSTVNVAPKDCRRRFTEDNRWGLNVVEGFALLRLQPEVIHHHGVHLVESSYEALEVASVWGSPAEEKLVLGACRLEGRGDGHGSPSSMITKPPTGGTRERLRGIIS